MITVNDLNDYCKFLAALNYVRGVVHGVSPSLPKSVVDECGKDLDTLHQFLETVGRATVGGDRSARGGVTLDTLAELAHDKETGSFFFPSPKGSTVEQCRLLAAEVSLRKGGEICSFEHNGLLYGVKVFTMDGVPPDDNGDDKEGEG